MSRYLSSKMLAVFVVVVIVMGAIGLRDLSWKDDDDPDVIKLSGDSKDQEKVMDILLDSESSRTFSAPLVVEDDPYLVLASTPAALWYEDDELMKNPLIVNSDGLTGDRFLQLYPHNDLVGVGDVGDFGETVGTGIMGSREEVSLEIAHMFWESSDGAILMGTGNESYHRSLPGIVLSSYLNIPLIITDDLNSNVRDTLKTLDVEYTLVFDGSKGYGKTITFQDTESVEDIVLELLMNKFGGVNYITLTNPYDLDLLYALPGISALAPYLTASHQGIICSAMEQPIPQGVNFREEADAFKANETTYRVKEKLSSMFDTMREHEVFEDYLEDSPYLAIMGSAYSIPFYYTYLVPKGIMAAPYQEINDPALVPTDDIYSDIDGDFSTHELAIGRPIGINLEDASGLIARAMFYQEYMAQWEAESPVSQLIGAEWRDSAFIHCGDDWNGYVLISSPAYVQNYEYLNTHGYTTYTTVATGETVDEVTRFFQSSNLVFILAHGSQTGFHMIDGYSAADVKQWWIGPSTFIVTSCNVGNTDCPNLTNIDNSIAFAIIRSGVAAFYGGMRYEYTGVYNPDSEYGMVTSGSPRLSQIIIKRLTEEDVTSGLALRDSKVQYMNELQNNEGMDYDVAIKILYGDPTFNPYEP